MLREKVTGYVTIELDFSPNLNSPNLKQHLNVEVEGGKEAISEVQAKCQDISG